MNSVRCPQCGFLNFSEATVCKRCKTELDLAQTENFFAQDSASFSTDAFQAQGFPAQSFAASPKDNYYAAQYNQFIGERKLKTGMAITSMIMGIIGFFVCGGLFGLLSVTGLVLGIIALVKASKKPAEYGGQGYAIAGIITNGMLVLMIPVIAAIAIPNLLAARRAANEASAIANVRRLMQAESNYLETSRSSRCADLSELASLHLIDSTLATGQKSGYSFRIVKKPDGNCEILATPQVATGFSKSGTHSFYVSTEEWEIRGADKNGSPATDKDPLFRMLDSEPGSMSADEDYYQNA